ncbi:hypothetical protein ES703_42861 [subsurface metagenome]
MDAYPAKRRSEFKDFNLFGTFFNIAAVQINYWGPVSDMKYKTGISSNFPSGFYPEALKFTFRLYDSKGVIIKGREFTHIVYLGD